MAQVQVQPQAVLCWWNQFVLTSLTLGISSGGSLIISFMICLISLCRWYLFEFAGTCQLGGHLVMVMSILAIHKMNLDMAIDHKALHGTFSAFGNILSCKIATDSSCQSKGYGFVQYDSEEGAQKAIEQLNGMVLNDKQVFVGPFVCKQKRELAADK